MVSSPGGITISGLKEFEKSRINKIVNKTVKATIKRSKELGKK